MSRTYDFQREFRGPVQNIRIKARLSNGTGQAPDSEIWAGLIK